MKALDILNYIVYENAVDFKEDKTDEQVKDFIEEAIEELEALQAPQTCEGCKWEHNHQVRALKCAYCSRQKHLSDHYEPKDTQ